MSKSQKLYEAVRKVSIEAVENLLTEPGVAKKINMMHEHGQETCLGAAVRSGSVGIIELLIAHKADLNMGTPEKTALHLACYGGDIRVCKTLVSNGADVEKVDSTNRTALQWAAKSGKPEIFHYLMEHKADPKHVSKNGNTILHDAIERCSEDFILELIEKEYCETDSANSDGETPLLLAATVGKVQVMKKLIALGAKTDVLNAHDETLLHVAARNNHLPVIEYLIDTLNVKAEFINQVTNKNYIITVNRHKIVAECWTALHLACVFGHAEVVKYLLDHGSDRNIRTGDGLKAVEICKAYKQKQLVPLFEQRRMSMQEEIPSKEQLKHRRKTMPAHSKMTGDWKI